MRQRQERRMDGAPSSRAGRLMSSLVAPSWLLAAGAPEGRGAEVEEECDDHGGDDKVAVVGAVCPAEAGLPQDRGEDQHRQEEEDACDLEPEDSAHALKGAQKAAQAGSDAAGGFAGCLGGGAGLLGAVLNLTGHGLGAGGHVLAGNAAGDAQAGAEDPSDGLRLHFDLMVTARQAVLLGAGSRRRAVALRRPRK